MRSFRVPLFIPEISLGWARAATAGRGTPKMLHPLGGMRKNGLIWNPSGERDFLGGVPKIKRTQRRGYLGKM